MALLGQARPHFVGRCQGLGKAGVAFAAIHAAAERLELALAVVVAGGVAQQEVPQQAALHRAAFIEHFGDKGLVFAARLVDLLRQAALADYAVRFGAAVAGGNLRCRRVKDDAAGSENLSLQRIKLWA